LFAIFYDSILDLQAGRPTNYKIAQMAGENMLCKIDKKKCANILIE